MSILEIAANITIALAIFLAGRNNIHTWWIGIIGCGLFAALLKITDKFRYRLLFL